MIELNRWLLGLMFLPGLCSAGVTYRMSSQSFGRLASGPSLSKYSVEGDRIRIEASDGKTVFIFRDETTYVIDTATHSAQVMRHATLAESARQIDESVKRLEEFAANAPADRRAMIDQAVAINKDIAARYHRPVLRDYRKTDRIETSEGRSCYVWEIWEQGAKRLELCVVPTAAVPGGSDALAAMRSLSTYLHGGMFAVGVEFGPVPQWSDVEALAGVPVIVREFEHGQVVHEIHLMVFHEQTVDTSLFEVPQGYSVQDAPVTLPNAGG
jgi:hypothetical protein